MKKLLLIFILILTLTGCSNTDLNKFFDKIETSNYILTITVNDNDVNILEVNNNTAYAYNLKDDVKSEEVYFTNLDSSYKTYIYSNNQWKTTSAPSYYSNYFGLLQIKEQKLTKGDNCYTFTYDIGTFNIYPEDSKGTLTNTVTNESVVYQYDFNETPIITLPF